MFQIVVDTDTAPATPNYFADLEKTVPAPSVIPLVQGFRGKVRVYFVGEHIPAETAGLALYVRPMNQKGKAVETSVAPQQSDDDGNVFYDIELAADTTALEVAIGARENVVMRGGLVAYDASVNPPTQIEWQMDLGVSASALGYGQTPPILPNAIEQHNLNESSHPFLLEKIRVVETDVSENYSELKTEISELEETVSANKSELKTEISELAGTVASNYSELSELAGTVSSNHSELKTELSELAGTVATEISEITSELSVLEQTVSTNKSELKTEISEVASELSALETELSENYSELKTEVSELAGTVACNYSELKTEISEVNSEVGVIKSKYVTTNTSQTITGMKTFDGTTTSFKITNHTLVHVCQSSTCFVGILKVKKDKNPVIGVVGGSANGVLYLPRCTGTFALTKNITTCTTAVKSELRSELQSELDAISGDMDCFGRLSAENTWTKQQVFETYSSFSNGAFLNILDLPLGAQQISINGGQYVITVPNKSGTLALASDIPDLCELGFALLAGNNTFTGNNTFNGCNVFLGPVFATGLDVSNVISFTRRGYIYTCDYSQQFALPINRSGELALTSDVPAICKTTVANYENITPKAGTLYFLTNS